MKFQFTDDRKREAQRILERYPTTRSAMLPLLWLVVDQEGYVPDDAIGHVAGMLGVADAEVAEVASFYAMFERSPQPVHHIRVCSGLCCRMKGADRMIEHLELRLGRGASSCSGEGRFRIQAVECLGLCDKSPSMIVGDEPFGDLTTEKVDEILLNLGAKF